MTVEHRSNIVSHGGMEKTIDLNMKEPSTN